MADHQTGTAADMSTDTYEYGGSLGDWLVVLTLLYFVPSIIAFGRHHHNRAAIRGLNAKLGWSVLGWITALVWALSPVRQETGDEDARTCGLTRQSARSVHPNAAASSTG